MDGRERAEREANARAAVLLCEACALLELASQAMDGWPLGEASPELRAWWDAHKQADAAR